MLTNNADFSLTAAGANLRVGDSANPVSAQLLIHNSTLTMAGGNLGIPYAAGATGVVSQVGGTVSGGIIAFNDNGAGSGLYQIVNGTLEPVQIRDDTGTGSSAIHFDNAILRPASGANSNFFSGVDIAEIQSGGLTLDAATDVAIAQVLSGSGALTKVGSAVVTLTGANTYTGNTLIQTGRLALPTTQTNATVVQVSDGAELGVNLRSLGSTLAVSAVAFNGSTPLLSFDFGSLSTPTAPLLRVPNLSANGPVTINVMNGLQLNTGQIVLVDYDGAIGF